MASCNPNPIYAFLTVDLGAEMFSEYFPQMLKMHFDTNQPDHGDLNLHFEITLETDLKFVKPEF